MRTRIPTTTRATIPHYHRSCLHSLLRQGTAKHISSFTCRPAAQNSSLTICRAVEDSTVSFRAASKASSWFPDLASLPKTHDLITGKQTPRPKREKEKNISHCSEAHQYNEEKLHSCQKRSSQLGLSLVLLATTYLMSSTC